MGTGLVRVTLTVVMVAFFAGLALDIAVPTVVLGAMAVSNWLVQSWPESLSGGWSLSRRWKGTPA
ncbi:hypothetical protein HHL25_07625 [Rhizobium sp. S-51]|jgi:hypothetical protein|uniref:Uncharacterized protein n=1 Tax=Rhizobium terricola TaxID=2728849 RepID=A0A7Y0AV28_9HYPH|nr:hypothetical protein [Rhizobium terricola]NML73989.1 hypothetical protein [Rhizobium terricola]